MAPGHAFVDKGFAEFSCRPSDMDFACAFRRLVAVWHSLAIRSPVGLRVHARPADNVLSGSRCLLFLLVGGRMVVFNFVLAHGRDEKPHCRAPSACMPVASSALSARCSELG